MVGRHRRRPGDGMGEGDCALLEAHDREEAVCKFAVRMNAAGCSQSDLHHCRRRLAPPRNTREQRGGSHAKASAVASPLVPSNITMDAWPDESIK